MQFIYFVLSYFAKKSSESLFMADYLLLLLLLLIMYYISSTMPFQKARPSQWKEAQPIKANVPSSGGTGSSMAKCHKVNRYLNML